MKLTALLLLTAASALAGIPAVGPDYLRPPTAAPSAYRYGDDPVRWKDAAPADAVNRGEWWTVFGDPALDRLERLALSRNQDLQAAAARVEQAVAAAGLARSAYSPQVAVAASASRGRASPTVGNPFPNLVTDDFSVPIVATWELDLFGRVRRLNESARADAQGSEATFESIRLSLTSNLAANYFSLRGADREISILRDTAALRRRSLELISAQFRNGAATELDTSRAETELATVDAEASALAVRRESLQDALAVLVGESAIAFGVPPVAEDLAVPVIPAGLPSGLLERRPDIAAAERALAAANARIGVAKAAFFPALSLTGIAGFESGQTERLFGADSRIWAFGPSLYLPLFQGGRNRANLERSRAVYDESIATYRQQVLVAFQEVQASLAATHLLVDQASAQDRAVTSAKRAADLAQKRYDAGYVSFLDVVDAERTELNNQRGAAQLATERLNVAVALIKALGGGWSATPVAGR